MRAEICGDEMAVFTDDGLAKAGGSKDVDV